MQCDLCGRDRPTAPAPQTIRQGLSHWRTVENACSSCMVAGATELHGHEIKPRSRPLGQLMKNYLKARKW